MDSEYCDGVQVGCVAAGALAAYLTVRWLQSSTRPSSALLPAGVDAALQPEYPTISSADVDKAAAAAAGALPHVGGIQLSSPEASVGELISTAEVLKQAARHPEIARSIGLPAACNPAAITAAAVDAEAATDQLTGVASSSGVIGAAASVWERTLSLPTAYKAFLSRLAAS